MSWKIETFGSLLTESRISCENPDIEKRIRVRLNVLGVEKRPVGAEKEGATRQFIRKAGQFIYGKQNFHKGAFGIIPDELDGYESSADIPSFDVREDCLPEWIYYYFKAGNRYLELSEYARGVGSQRIHPKQLEDFKIPLPPKEIQQKIIEELKTIEKDELTTELTHQLTLVKQLRQSFLREAMQGKLTADFRSAHPELTEGENSAQALLEKIKAEKKQLIKDGKLKKEKELSPVGEDEIPFEIPEGWVWCRLGEIAYNIEYGTSEKADLNSANIPVLRMNNIQNGKIVLDNLKYVKHTIKDLPKLYLFNNDLLFNRTNSWELVGKSGVYKGQNFVMTFASYLIRIQFIEQISVDFINSYINSSFCRESQLEPHIIQQNGQANFNGTKLKNIITPLPPLSEQQAIVSKLDELMRTCDELEASIRTSQQQNEMLLREVLREALEG